MVPTNKEVRATYIGEHRGMFVFTGDSGREYTVRNTLDEVIVLKSDAPGLVAAGYIGEEVLERIAQDTPADSDPAGDPAGQTE